MSTFHRLERRKKSCQTSDVIHFCRLVAFFQKNTIEKRNLESFRFRSEFCFLPSFWLVFLSTRIGEGKRVLYSLGVTTYLFRRKTLCLRKEEERRKKSERTSFERERARSVVFSYIYLFVVYSLFLLERKREFLPLLWEKKGVVWSCIDFARDTRAERKRSAKKKKPFWCGCDECERRRCADQDGGNRTRVTSG